MIMTSRTKDFQSTILKLDIQFFANPENEGKTEKPTAKKLDKARDEGQVAKSQEVATAFMFILLFGAMRVFGGFMFRRMLEISYFSLNMIKDVQYIFESPQFLSKMVSNMLVQIIIICGPILAIAFAIGFISNVIQVGWKPKAKPLKPKLSNLNPKNGIKKIFSMKSLMELFKSLLKLAIIGSIAIGELRKEASFIMIVIDMGLMNGLGYVANFCMNLAIRIGGWFLFIAAADFIYQKHNHIKKLKMSKQEVKDEYKNAEGDPQIKAKIKGKMREVSMRRMMQDLPNADVIITNPTHYAVALRYNRERASAPLVVAKGADLMAKRIKDAAKEHNIEIVENKNLARTIYATVDVGKEIPPELYQAVAEILAFVFSLKNVSI